jgi:hypothetical protein
MVVRGQVRDGVVVLTDGIRLPEGEEVTVLASGPTLADRQIHGILDIPPVSLGPVLHPVGVDEDVLGEMLEDR